MNKIFLQYFSKILFVLVLVFSIYSCDSATVTPSPEANTISGTVTFADTNFTFTGGYYDVAAFNSWPPSGAPTGDDSVTITKNGNVYTASYKIKGLANGSYVLAMGWRPIAGGQSPVMGLYGCDTSHNFSCVPTSVSITHNTGVENINFICWADTSKKLF
jgi:hypothetical protein